uniref:Giant n=1 Tax=Oncopeltus fasciatus TaxID=7536 RepID=D3JD14_ONCFA|nr:giant [Oncopeltus fasciatus]
MYNLGGYMHQPENAGVLDLRVYKAESQHPSEDLVSGQLTPPRDEACISPTAHPVLSPTLAITQRVLAAANQPQAGTRPFKAYPKDPLALGTAQQDETYLRFREEMLSQVRSGKQQQGGRNRGAGSSPNHSETDEKDAAYWERRRKNNEAAKRSRDARRAKEDEIAIRAAFLEQENLKLKYQIAAITEEYNHMRRMFYDTRHHHTIQPMV